jgi:hypothetical protein
LKERLIIKKAEEFDVSVCRICGAMTAVDTRPISENKTQGVLSPYKVLYKYSFFHSDEVRA